MSAQPPHRPPPGALQLALRYAAPVLAVAAAALFYVPQNLASLDEQRIAHHCEDMANLLGVVIGPGLAFDGPEHVLAKLAAYAPGVEARQVRVLRSDGGELALWRAPGAASLAPLEVDSAAGLASDLRFAAAAVPTKAGPPGQILVAFDVGRTLRERERHITLMRVTIGLLLLIGLIVSALAAAYSVRRRRTEAALRRSTASSIELLNSLPDGAAILRDGVVRYVNPAFRGLMVVDTEADLLGLRFETLIHPDDRSAVTEQLDLLQSGQVRHSTAERRLIAPDGQNLIAALASVHFEFEGGPAVATIARDLTEAKKVQAQVAFADRMMSVGTLAAGMAHEVNNPLTFVVGNLDLLAKEVQGHEEALANIGLEDLPEIIADAIVGAQRVRRIISDLKGFSGAAEDQTIGPVDVADLLDASAKMADAEIRHRATLVREYGEVPSVSGNEASLCQVFLNLIINAAHAMDVGDTAKHELRLVTRMVGDDRVAVEIHDTGAGIPAEHIPRLFDPFFSTKAVGQGTGLGLSICHNIVTDHGGSIEARSEVGKGTEFTVLLPVAEQRQARKKRAFAATGRVASAAVLVIDDEKHVGTLFGRVLSPRHRVVAESSATAARDRLLGGEYFDVIFCDVMMPDLSGPKLYEQVVAARPELASRFIFISGGAFTKEAQDFVALHEGAMLNKPFTPAEIKAALNEKLPELLKT